MDKRKSMKDLEKNIIDAAEAYGDRQGSAIRVSRKHGFIDGAKSDAAKEYHTQGMYTKQDIRNAFNAGIDYGLDEYNNLPNFDKWVESIEKKE